MSIALAPDEVVALNRLTLVARLMAGTTHEINNALQIISGSAELLAGLNEMSDGARRAVDRISSQANRAAATAHDLMQFASDRSDAAARLHLRDVAHRAIQIRRFAARRSGLEVTFDAAAAAPGSVHASGAQVLQAVLNLLINAEQALQGVAGGRIALELIETSGSATLRIADNGRGLDPAVAERAFDPFVTTRAVPDATGLGLTASRIIARRHGGDVALEQRAQGCCAVLRLPSGG